MALRVGAWGSCGVRGDRNVVGLDLGEAAVAEVEVSTLQAGGGWCRVGSLGCVRLVSTQNTFAMAGALRNRHRLVLFQIFELHMSECVCVCVYMQYIKLHIRPHDDV